MTEWGESFGAPTMMRMLLSIRWVFISGLTSTAMTRSTACSANQAASRPSNSASDAFLRQVDVDDREPIAVLR